MDLSCSSIAVLINIYMVTPFPRRGWQRCIITPTLRQTIFSPTKASNLQSSSFASGVDKINQDAVRKLMLLQSGKSVRAQLVRNRIAGKVMKSTNVEEMEKLLKRVGLPLSRLDEISGIHVAGTKGKGSTCSMCESILRQHGLRTGLFTGPHLVQPRERVRLDGRSLAQDKFAAHVQRLYELLLDTQGLAEVYYNNHTSPDDIQSQMWQRASLSPYTGLQLFSRRLIKYVVVVI